MYEQFREDPDSVGEAWQEFFADYKSTNPALSATPRAVPEDSPTPPPRSHPQPA